MEIGQSAGILVVGIVAVVAVGWGALLSVNAAARGPAWALSHVTALTRLLALPLLFGLALTFVVRPRWVGLAVVYIALIVWVLAGILRRNLSRVQADGGFVDIPSERREAIVGRARRSLILVGIVLAFVGVVVTALDVVTGILVVALGLVLAGAGWLVGNEAS